MRQVDFGEISTALIAFKHVLKTHRNTVGLFDLVIHRDAIIIATNSWSSVRLERGYNRSSPLAGFDRREDALGFEVLDAVMHSRSETVRDWTRFEENRFGQGLEVE